jgi:ATP phosphoribosyltransferase
MITIAIPTGRLGKQVLSLLFEKNITSEHIEPQRKLTYIDAKRHITYILVKPSDVITYVTSGYADLGIVGSDLITEESQHMYELLDLKIGMCKMIVAGLDAYTYRHKEVLKVATKFPEITKAYFKSKKQDIDIVYLNGSVELAPLLKLSDVIVDITETGTTLHENGLHIFDTILDVSARLITNPSSYILKQDIIQSIKKTLSES